MLYFKMPGIASVYPYLPGAIDLVLVLSPLPAIVENSVQYSCRTHVAEEINRNKSCVELSWKLTVYGINAWGL